jgi:hypothetical protein
MNIAAKIVERNSKNPFASQKLTSSLPVHTVTAPARKRNYPQLFHLERDRLPPPAQLEAVALPAAGFPEEDNCSGRAPLS